MCGAGTLAAALCVCIKHSRAERSHPSACTCTPGASAVSLSARHCAPLCANGVISLHADVVLGGVDGARLQRMPCAARR
jgi:hypothetical protein